MLEARNRNTRTRCEVCLKIKERKQNDDLDNFIVKSEQISHIFLVSLLLNFSW